MRGTWGRRGAPRLAGALVALLVLLAPTDVASAAPATRAVGPVHAPAADLCASLEAALQSVQAQIEQHNATPNVFDESQAAALAAYDAEAAALTAAQETAIANLQSCLDAASLLATDNSTVDLKPPTEKARQVLQQAKDKIGNDWTPPAAPAVGKNWTVPKSSPPRALYDALRSGNPPELGAATLRGQARPAVGADDPAYANRTFLTAADGLSAASADHIIPIARQIYLPGFVQLTPDNMYVVTRAPLNFQWLSFKANLSKQSRSVAGMTGVDPRWQAEQIELEDETVRALQDAIDRLLASQGTPRR